MTSLWQFFALCVVAFTLAVVLFKHYQHYRYCDDPLTAAIVLMSWGIVLHIVYGFGQLYSVHLHKTWAISAALYSISALCCGVLIILALANILHILPRRKIRDKAPR